MDKSVEKQVYEVLETIQLWALECDMDDEVEKAHVLGYIAGRVHGLMEMFPEEARGVVCTV